MVCQTDQAKSECLSIGPTLASWRVISLTTAFGHYDSAVLYRLGRNFNAGSRTDSFLSIARLGPFAQLNDSLVDQPLVAGVMNWGYRMVGSDCEPGVAICCNLLGKMPGGNVGSDAGVEQLVGVDVELPQLRKVHAVDLCNTNVNRSIAILAYGIWAKGGLDLQNCPQHFCVDAVICGGRFNASCRVGGGWGLCGDLIR